MNLVALDKQGWRQDYWAGQSIKKIPPIKPVGSATAAQPKQIQVRYKGWVEPLSVCTLRLELQEA